MGRTPVKGMQCSRRGVSSSGFCHSGQLGVSARKTHMMHLSVLLPCEAGIEHSGQREELRNEWRDWRAAGARPARPRKPVWLQAEGSRGSAGVYTER